MRFLALDSIFQRLRVAWILIAVAGIGVTIAIFLGQQMLRTELKHASDAERIRNLATFATALGNVVHEPSQRLWFNFWHQSTERPLFAEAIRDRDALFVSFLLRFGKGGVLDEREVQNAVQTMIDGNFTSINVKLPSNSSH